jgi:hypothetical protein
MPELTAADVNEFTGGRLADDEGDGLTTDMLNAALAAARRAVGWHVSPARTADVVIIDGPDSRILYLPTRKLNDLTSVDEDGTALVPSTALRWNAGGPPGGHSEPVRVRKRSNGWWTDQYQSITVTMDHGYTEAEAADWRYAVLSMVNQMAMVTTGVSEDMLIRKTVDDVTLGYASPFSAVAEEAVGSVSHILSDFALPVVEYM